MIWNVVLSASITRRCFLRHSWTMQTSHCEVCIETNAAIWGAILNHLRDFHSYNHTALGFLLSVIYLFYKKIKMQTWSVWLVNHRLNNPSTSVNKPAKSIYAHVYHHRHRHGTKSAEHLWNFFYSDLISILLKRFNSYLSGSTYRSKFLFICSAACHRSWTQLECESWKSMSCM